MRYDLIYSNKGHNMLKENEVFDYYDDIFDVGENEKVKTNTPLVSFNDHKLAYIIQDKEFLKPNKFLIVPFLHERNMNINKLREGNDYFMTQCNVRIKDELLFRNYQ